MFLQQHFLIPSKSIFRPLTVKYSSFSVPSGCNDFPQAIFFIHNLYLQVSRMAALVRGKGVVISPPYIRFSRLLGAAAAFFLVSVNFSRCTPFLRGVPSTPVHLNSSEKLT